MIPGFRSFGALVALAVLAAACTGGGDELSSSRATGTGATGTVDPASLVVQVASSDLFVGEPQRVNVGVYASYPESGVLLVTGGEIEVAFAPFESEAGSTDGGAARYLPARVLRADLDAAEGESEGGWVMMPRTARPYFRYRAYTRPDRKSVV